MFSNHVRNVVFPSLYFWDCTDVWPRNVLMLPDCVCTVSLSPPLTLHESSKGLKRGDSGPKLATPRIFPHVLAAPSCFWRTSWFPIERKAPLVRGGSGHEVAPEEKGKITSRTPPPGRRFSCLFGLRWNCVVSGDRPRRVPRCEPTARGLYKGE